MAKDSDPTTTYNFKGDSTYDEDTWVYSIISVKMFYGFSTELSFYKNNYISGSMITGPIFMIDFAAYPAYVAAHRSGTSTWSSDYFEGYIYEFHIYNEEYSRGATHYLSTGWTNSIGICTPENPFIESGDYNTYSDGTLTWDVSCLNSCVDGEPCVGSCNTNEEFCWLWYDREC